MAIDKENSKRFKQAMQRGLERAVQDIGDQLVMDAVRLVPVRTGNLQRSIQWINDENDKSKISIIFMATAPYAASVEFGVRPYMHPGVKPKRKKYLRFTPKGSDKPIFVKEVKPFMHPGQAAKPFMRPSIHKNITKQNITNMVKKNLKLAFKNANLLR